MASSGNGPSGLCNELFRIAQRTRQVWTLIRRRDRVSLGAATMVMASGAWFNARISVVLGDLATEMDNFNKAGGNGGLPDARSFLLLLAVYFLVREALQVVRKFLVHNTCTRVEKDTTVKLVSHLLQLDLSRLSQERVGALHGRIRRSIEGFVRLLQLSFMDFLSALLTAAFALGVAIHRNPFVGLLMAGVVPLAMFIVFRQVVSQKGIRLSLLRCKESVDGTVVEQLGGIEYVRAANTHQHEAEKVGEVTELVREKEIRHHIAMSLFDCAKALNEGFFFILVIGVTILLVAQHHLTTGDVVTFPMLFASVLVPLREVHRIVDEAHESSLKVGDLMEMMSEPVDPSFKGKLIREPMLLPDTPVIAMSNLRAGYSTGDGNRRQVIRGITVSIARGEAVGVAGRSGSGKTTWLRLLMRLTHPTDGSLFLGGIPIDNVSRAAIGRLVGYVGQVPFIFAGTIRENITYGFSGPTHEDVRNAARLAGIHEEIMAMPGGYDARVAERGQNLSGGQRQRLALARVFLRNPPILILDEATSALDNISERRIHEALAATSRDRTVIMVAHRLSTLRDTSRILVFDQGSIAEVGNYDDLSRRGGIFAELVRCAEDRKSSPCSSDQRSVANEALRL